MECAVADLSTIERRIAPKAAAILEESVDEAVIWEYEPVGFREFCESSAYLGTFPLSERQYHDVDMLLGTDPKATFSPERDVSLLVLVYGKGGGKDEVASRIAVYVVYLLLCMANPQEYLFGIRSNAELHLLNVAKKGRQAERIFFKYFANHVLNARWFKDHYDLEYQGKWQSKVIRRSRLRGVIRVMGNGAEFPKHITCLAETTENESWEGYNVVFYTLDEISGFTSVTEQQKGWSIFDTARTSMSSRATKSFKGLGVAISYPRQEEGDIILDLLKMAADTPTMHGSLAYPWISKGMNNYSGETFIFRHPRLDSYFGLDNVGVEIPIEFFDEFNQYPESSMTKFLCIPPMTAGMWIEYPERVEVLISPRDDPQHPRFRRPLFITEDSIITAPDSDGKITRYLVKHVVQCTATTQYERYQIPRVVWLDAAQKYCDAVIGVGHLEMRTLLTDQGAMPMEVVVQDDELIWRPDPARGVQVSIHNVEHFLTDVIPGFVTVVAAGADAWNSAQIEEKLKMRGIRTVIHNLNREDYELTKRYLYLGAMDLFDGVGVRQLVRLVNSGTSSKPQKKPGALQDAADAIVGIVHLLAGADKRGRPISGRRLSRGLPRGVTGGMRPTPAPMEQVAPAPAGMPRATPMPLAPVAHRSASDLPGYPEDPHGPVFPGGRSLPTGLKV